MHLAFVVKYLKITSFLFFFPQELFASSLGAHSTGNKWTNKKCPWHFFT